MIAATTVGRRFADATRGICVERVTGVEPALSVWESDTYVQCADVSGLLAPLVTADDRDEQHADSTRPRPGNVLIRR